MGRADKADSRGSAVPPLISQLRPEISVETAALLEEASAALARFDASVGTVTAPFLSILLRTESAASSEIEQLTASAKQISLAELGVSRSANAKLIVGNVRAMRSAVELSENLSEAAMIAMHEALLGESQPELTGGYRAQQVWIGGGGISPHQASFVPPHHENVEPLMADLVRFMQRQDLPVLAQVAISHAQFETIHPFPDGNGRAGRALIHALLRAAGLTRNVTVPVSAGLLKNTAGYFAALTAYREGNLEPILRAFADAAFIAISNGEALVAELLRLRESWSERVAARKGSGAARLQEVLLGQPVVSVKIAQEALKISQPAASNAIVALENAGVLRQTSAARRNRFWEAPEVLDALEEFAARARRGGGL